MEKKDVAIQVKNPLAMIQAAIDKGLDLEKLEKLLSLQERYDANEARKAYTKSMAIVHKNISFVAKTLTNTHTRSKYASLDNIIIQTKEVYTAEGFSISFYEETIERPEYIRICAKVTHKLGHFESYHYDIPLDGKGLKGNANMTAIHAKASSTSYAQRYLMCMIWNIPTGTDNDGNGAVKEKIDENKIKIIRSLLAEVKADEQKFLKYLEVKKLEDLPKSGFLKAKIALETKKKSLKK